jgi:hypothetical protein
MFQGVLHSPRRLRKKIDSFFYIVVPYHVKTARMHVPWSVTFSQKIQKTKLYDYLDFLSCQNLA